MIARPTHRLIDHFVVLTRVCSARDVCYCFTQPAPAASSTAQAQGRQLPFVEDAYALQITGYGGKTNVFSESLPTGGHRLHCGVLNMC